MRLRVIVEKDHANLTGRNALVEKWIAPDGMEFVEGFRGQHKVRTEEQWDDFILKMMENLRDKIDPIPS